MDFVNNIGVINPHIFYFLHSAISMQNMWLFDMFLFPFVSFFVALTTSIIWGHVFGTSLRTTKL